MLPLLEIFYELFIASINRYMHIRPPKFINCMGIASNHLRLIIFFSISDGRFIRPGGTIACIENLNQIKLVMKLEKHLSQKGAIRFTMLFKWMRNHDKTPLSMNYINCLLDIYSRLNVIVKKEPYDFSLLCFYFLPDNNSLSKSFFCSQSTSDFIMVSNGKYDIRESFKKPRQLGHRCECIIGINAMGMKIYFFSSGHKSYYILIISLYFS